MEQKNDYGFLQGNSGALSMRRLLALVFGITSILAGTAAVVLVLIGNMLTGNTVNYAWAIILVSYLAPGTVSLLFMFFTTWEDVAKVASVIRK